MCEKFSMEIKIWYLLKIFNIHQISICPKLFLTKSLNFEIYSDFIQYFQKIWSQEKFRQFAKNPYSQTSWHIHTKWTGFFGWISATILFLNSADILFMSNCLNSSKKSKAISYNFETCFWIRLILKWLRQYS